MGRGGAAPRTNALVVACALAVAACSAQPAAPHERGELAAPAAVPVPAPIDPAPPPASASASATIGDLDLARRVLPLRARGDLACGGTTCREPDEFCCDFHPIGAPARAFCARATREELESGRELGPGVALRACTDRASMYDALGVFFCDDSDDCDGGRCVKEGNWEAPYMACEPRGYEIELCREGTCKTPGTACRAGKGCGQFDRYCAGHGVCEPTTFPRCGAKRCTADAPLCCVDDRGERCSASCDFPPDSKRRSSLECRGANDCGPEMDCCLSRPSGSAHCSFQCDTGTLEAACDTDADCAVYAFGGLGHCRAESNPLFGVKSCRP